MEIEKYLNQYKKYSPRVFYEWVSQGRVMEVRFLTDYRGEKFSAWSLIRELAEKLDLEYRYNSLFITSFDDLKFILLFKGLNNYPLTRLYNIFISINPKRKIYMKSKNGLLYKAYQGSIVGTSHIQNSLCDIEHKYRNYHTFKEMKDFLLTIREKVPDNMVNEFLEKAKGSSTELMLEECILGAKHIVKALKLKDYYINLTGNGANLWIRFNPEMEMVLPNYTELDDKIKYNYKEESFMKQYKRYNRWIVKLDKILQNYNPFLKVDDGAKDLSRITRPPGSWNVKINKTHRAVGTVFTEVKDNQYNILINKQYMAVEPLISKASNKYVKSIKRSRNNRYNHLSIIEAPLYKLLVSKMLPSSLSRNHYLEQSFARILRDNEIDFNQIQYSITKMNEVQGKNVQVDPEYLQDDEEFNSETVNSYCITCRVDLVYPLLDGVLIVKDFINELKLIELKSYSAKTIEILLKDIEIPAKPKTYHELKMLVRNLIDVNSRSNTLFILREIYKNEIDYYDRNNIFTQLINKTRAKK